MACAHPISVWCQECGPARIATLRERLKELEEEASKQSELKVTARLHHAEALEEIKRHSAEHLREFKARCAADVRVKNLEVALDAEEKKWGTEIERLKVRLLGWQEGCAGLDNEIERLRQYISALGGDPDQPLVGRTLAE